MPDFKAQMRSDQVLDQATAIEILQERADAGVAETTKGDVVAAVIIATMMTPSGQHAVVSFRGDPVHLKTAVDTMTPQVLSALETIRAAQAQPTPPEASQPRPQRRAPGGSWGMFKRR